VASGHRVEQGRKRIPGNWALAFGLERLDPVRRFRQARRKVIDPLMEDFHFQATLLTKDVGHPRPTHHVSATARRKMNQYLYNSRGRAAPNGRNSTTVLSPIVYTYYCINCNKATQPMPARRQR
jgi:hypothetical protein